MHRAILLLYIAAFTGALTSPINGVERKMMNSAQTAELKSLKDERDALQADVVRLRVDEDKWNGWNRNLAIAAVLIGTLLGVFSWRSQKQASAKGLEARPLTDRRDILEARIRELLDQQSGLDIAKAQQDAADANERAGNAQKIAESERLARVTLEAQIAPRRLSIEQQTKIKDACVGIYGKRLVIESYAQDEEGSALATDVAAALSLFNIEPHIGEIAASGTLDAGVHVQGPAEEASIVNCIADALRNVGRLTVFVNAPVHPVVRYNDPRGGFVFTEGFLTGHDLPPISQPFITGDSLLC